MSEDDIDKHARAELHRLRGLTVNELQDEYFKEIGRGTNGRNKEWLVRKVFYAVQERLEGRTLSAETRTIIVKLSGDVTVRTRHGRSQDLRDLGSPKKSYRPVRDPRLPPSGTHLERVYKGKSYKVLVLEHGFEFAGQVYRGLSGVARAITGRSWNGFVFFKLNKETE